MRRPAADFAQIRQADVRSRHRTLLRLFVAALTFLVVAFAGRVPTATLASGDPPHARSDSLSTREATPLDVFLSWSDNEFDEVTFEVVDPPDHGALDPAECQLGACTYAPDTDPNYVGPDSFTFRVNDGTSDSDLATVSIERHHEAGAGSRRSVRVDTRGQARRDRTQCVRR